MAWGLVGLIFDADAGGHHPIGQTVTEIAHGQAWRGEAKQRHQAIIASAPGQPQAHQRHEYQNGKWQPPLLLCAPHGPRQQYPTAIGGHTTQQQKPPHGCLGFRCAKGQHATNRAVAAAGGVGRGKGQAAQAPHP